MDRRTFLTTTLGAAASLAAAETTDLASLTVAQAADRLRRKSVSSTDLTRACLARIDKVQPVLNAFITITADRALADARTADDEIRAGKWRGPFHGVPIALKDNIDTAGIRTTGASEVFKDRVPTEDAEVARRLKAAGAVMLGKLNLHEFAYGGTSAVTWFGPVHNPWNPKLTPGGSSGGPGAAVAADMCFASVGTDTAGSVRIPASYCSIAGLMPTFGRISIRGIIPLSWELDRPGPMCKSVEDTAILMNLLAGYDAADTAAVNVPVPDYVRALRTPTAKLRVGIPRKPYYDNLNPDVAKAVDSALAVLKKLTASMTDVTLPAAPNAGSLISVEAYTWHQQWIDKTPELYDAPVRRAIQNGANVKAAVYAQALRDVARVRREIVGAFDHVDVLVLPTMADPPFEIETGKTRNVSARNTSPFDAYGIPMISIPCGFTSENLPIGLQIGAAPWAEGTVLALAHAYEQATEWHTRKPPLG
jgi:aspartyl-tRNA(Asn)/glutamyl-tRNA(Gln) amidotransferase subunit A